MRWPIHRKIDLLLEVFREEVAAFTPECSSTRRLQEIHHSQFPENPQVGPQVTVAPLVKGVLAAWVGEFYLRLQTMGSLNSGGIREKQWSPWVSTDAARP
jgi:hypothetical protein